MDLVRDRPEPGDAGMRREIDNTRSAMANKLEALEDKLIDTVQSAKETMKDSLQSATDTVASVKRTFDLRHQVEQRPWTMVGGCFLVGLTVGHLFPRDRSPSRGLRSMAAPTPHAQAEAPSRSRLLEPFQAEIDKVKRIAIGYVMGLVRDSIKDSVPQLAPTVDDLLNGLTSKLGGAVGEVTPKRQREDSGSSR